MKTTKKTKKVSTKIRKHKMAKKPKSKKLKIKKLKISKKFPLKLAFLEKKAENLTRISSELIEKGRKRGFITYDEILKTFPDIENNILFLDELYEKFAIAGIDVLEGGNLLNLNVDLTDKDLNKSTMHDSIQMYLKEIGQYPLIHAGEEKELARRIEHGDLEAKNLLARANLRLVVSIAKRYGQEVRALMEFNGLTDSRLRIGQTDVLGGQDDQPAGDKKRVLTRLDQAGEIVEGGIGVAGA